MRPYPTTDELSAQLDEYLGARYRELEKQVMDLATVVGLAVGAGRSLVAAALHAVRHPDTPDDVRSRLNAAIHQWQQIDKQ